MTGKEFRAILRKRGHTNETFAQAIRRSIRTVTRYATDASPIPYEIEIVLASLKRPKRGQR